MKSIVAIFALKDNLFNSVLILERDWIILSKQLERKTHILLLMNICTDKFLKSSTIQVLIQDLIYYLLLNS
jgi:hypothetical protein